MSPIFVRPVREQLEHDRLIRFLQTKYKRKFDVAMNVGDEQVAPVKLGNNTYFPDLVLTEGKKLAGLVEVESGESVNNLEAMAQWVHFSRARVPFHLYVPVHGYDAARRLCEQNSAAVSEIWTYRPAMDGFDLVRMFYDTKGTRGAKEPTEITAKAAKEGTKGTKEPRPITAKAKKGTKGTKGTKAPRPIAAKAAKSTKSARAKPAAKTPSRSGKKAGRSGKAGRR